ncbi:MAG: DUF72 domain-containing protein [Nitrospirae bacterium]|nr:DUF72 domain-containing protein [Nitrospirota bacterium]
MQKYKIGCSGFMYDAWKGVFYPEELPQKNWLSFYGEKFDALELNVTFYRLLKKEAFERWYKETSPRFSFSLKGSRFITHVKKLKDVELPLSTFFNTTAPLMEKLEVVLWQLPPNLKANLKVLKEFIEALKPYPMRYAFEFRHKSWINSKVFKLLSTYNIAVCMADWPPFIEEVPLTADFVYIRRHGKGGNYSTPYPTEQLKKDAKKIKAFMKEGKDVYIFFNNDAFGYAPQNAKELKEILAGPAAKASLKKKVVPAKKVKPKKKTTPKKVKPKEKAILKKKPAPKKVKPKKKAVSKKKTKPVPKKHGSKGSAKKQGKKPVKKPVKKKTAKKSRR